MTIATTHVETAGALPMGKSRMRAAIVVDVAVGLATIPAFTFCLTQLNALLWIVAPQTRWQVTWWSMLLMSSITLVLVGTVVALLARLTAQGQTPGLAAVGLRWGDGTDRAAQRRLLGEPQFWCAALPVVYLLLAFVVGTVQSIVRLAWPYDAMGAWLYGAMSTVGALIGPALVVGALACMVVSRRRPGWLVPRW